MTYLAERKKHKTRTISSHRIIMRKTHHLLGQKVDLRYPRAHHAGAARPTPLAGVFAVNDQEEPDPQQGEMGAEAGEAARRRLQPQLEPAPTGDDESQDA
jgi:hypothetical protein